MTDLQQYVCTFHFCGKIFFLPVRIDVWCGILSFIPLHPSPTHFASEETQLDLNSKPPSDIVITFYTLFLLLRLYPLLFQYTSLLVFSVESPPRQYSNANVQTQIRKRKRMTQDISRCCLSSVQLRAQYRTQIADCDLHGCRCSSFRLARYIDGRK